MDCERKQGSRGIGFTHNPVKFRSLYIPLIHITQPCGAPKITQLNVDYSIITIRDGYSTVNYHQCSTYDPLYVNLSHGGALFI